MRLSVDSLAKRFGGRAALDGVTLAMEPGTIVAVLGANGAGKTTLLRCLATVNVPTSGEILVDGEALTRSRLDLRRRIFFLPDLPLMHAGTTPVAHAAMVGRLYGAEDAPLAQRIYGLLEDFDLLGSARGRMENLSRGQVYKAALTALFAVEPELAIVDEPFASGIDPHAIATFKKRSRALAAAGGTLVYSTQILEVAEGFSDRVAILDRGRLHAYAPVSELGHRDAEGSVLGAVLETLREKPA